MTPLRVLSVSLVVLLAACGDGGEPVAREPATAADGAPLEVTDSVAAAPDTTPPRPAIPAEFPSDFPLPPDHVVLEASSSRDISGTYSTARLAVTAADAEEPFAWYRRALADAGWQVSVEGRAGEERTLHAMQGESYVDLTVSPDASRPGRVVIDASIWKVDAL